MSFLDTAAPSCFTGRDSPEREAEVLLSLVASGLVALSRWRGDVDRRRPYDDRLQLGLDRLAAVCVREGLEPPVGVADLVWDWCAERPMRKWPLVFDPDAQADGERLLVDGEPSEFCSEWVRSSLDVVGDVHESALVEHVRDIARALGRPELYARWRKLLTDSPILPPAGLIAAKGDFPEVAAWAVWLDESYEPIPSEDSIDGQVAVCRSCRQWMSPTVSGSWLCPSWRCARERFPAAPEMQAAAGAYRLRPELVRYIALPGQSELKLANALAARGAQVVMSPGYDALDVLAVWPGGFAVGVDVKDWRNPYLLARKIKRFPEWRADHQYAYEKGFVAVPRDRARGKRGYLRILRKHSSALRAQPDVHAITIEDLIKQCPDLDVPGQVTCGP